MSDALLPAHRLAERLGRGELSARDLVELYLERIARFDPQLNAVVSRDPERARADADAADAALRRGEPIGPLHGVPITVKDLFDTAGLRSTYGYPPRSRHVPDRDATAVARLRAAGAIVLGKTNVPFVGVDWQTWSPIFGRTSNPWDPGRTCGGSSGGSAVAVAAGLSALDLGSDIAGSIRVPAHFCGVYGLKPTERRVSGHGHADAAGTVPHAVRHLLTYGPLARSVTDLRLVLSVVAGPDPDLPDVPPVPLAPPRPREPTWLRLAWTDDLGGVPVSADTRATLAAAAEALAAAGCTVERRAPGLDLEAALAAWGGIAGAEIAGSSPRLARWAARVVLPYFYGRTRWTRSIRRGLGGGMHGYLAALAVRDALAAELDAFLGGYDALLCPVTCTPAFTHRRAGRPIEVDGRPVPYAMAAGAYAAVFALTGHPVVALPAGRSAEGLPIGVQVVGRRWADDTLLDVADAVDRVVRGYRVPPRVASADAAGHLSGSTDRQP